MSHAGRRVGGVARALAPVPGRWRVEGATERGPVPREVGDAVLDRGRSGLLEFRLAPVCVLGLRAQTPRDVEALGEGPPGLLLGRGLAPPKTIQEGGDTVTLSKTRKHTSTGPVPARDHLPRLRVKSPFPTQTPQRRTLEKIFH